MWIKFGVWILILIIIFIFGRVWFHMVEWLLSKIKALFSRCVKPPVWHTFEEKDEEKNNTYDLYEYERRR